MEGTCCLADGFIFDRKRDRDACVCMCTHTHAGCMSVYVHTHSHTAHGVLDVSRGVGTRHLESPKNPYMYARGRNDILDKLLLFFNIFFLP